MENEAIDVAVPTLARKLSEIMGEIHRIPKRGRNEFHKYDYVTESDLSEAVRQKMSDRFIEIVPKVVSYARHELLTDKGVYNGCIYDVTLEVWLEDGESGEKKLGGVMVGSGYDKGDKAVYKAITGATKYWIYKKFLIPTGDDPEADSKTDKAVAEVEQKRVLENKLADIAEEKKETSQPAKKGCISAPQQKRLWAIAKQAGWQNEEIKDFLKMKYGLDHTADIPKDKYEEICTTLEGGTAKPPGDDDLPF